MFNLNKGEVIVTRRCHFNAAHRLHNPNKSDDWNAKTFGLCNSVNWHGHNYNLEVQVAGVPDSETGYVIDLGELAKIIDDKILKLCDHKNLNLDVPFLKNIIPSSENLVVAFWQQLFPSITNNNRRLFCIRLFETERNWVEYFGE
jgi:6-pyruvoyltetrahydropterin/6-carboxytetrahydropterin synthase